MVGSPKPFSDRLSWRFFPNSTGHRPTRQHAVVLLIATCQRHFAHKKNKWILPNVYMRIMQSIPSSSSNKSVRSKPESFSRVSETMKQTNEVEKKAGKKMKLWSKQQDGKRAHFHKDKKSSSVRDLRRIKRRLFLDAVKSSPRQHPSVPGKKNRTGREWNTIVDDTVSSARPAKWAERTWCSPWMHARRHKECVDLPWRAAIVVSVFDCRWLWRFKSSVACVW